MNLKTSQLSIKYKNSTLLRFPDLELKAGERILIKGPSGCGKTSWLYALCGILPLHSGKIMVGDVEFSTLPIVEKDRFRARNFGLIFQEARLLPSLTVNENVQLATNFISPKEVATQIPEILSLLDLEKVKNKKIGQISSGEKQRTTIARVLLQKPSFILADEPTSALDDQRTEDVINLLIQSAKTINAGLIVVTHDLRLDPYFSQKMDLS